MTDFRDCFYETYRHHKENKAKGIEIHDDHSKEVIKYVLKQPKKTFPGLNPFEDWQAYSLTTNPGFILIRNWMKPSLLKHLTKRCLKDFVRKPHKTNLDTHVAQESIESIWEDHINGIFYIPDFWSQVETPPKKRMSQKGGMLMKRLRWSTLGYHHNWDTKVYSEEMRSDFPDDVAELSSVLAESAGWLDFRAEASIVNFYHRSSSLSGHVDRSEYDTTSPIISISLGCTAVFLIGGTEKSVRPTALNLRSGDVAIMSGDSRLSYHAVPCILPGTYRQVDKEEDEEEEVGEKDSRYFLEKVSDDEWKNMEKFLRCSRINVNTRQVNLSKPIV